MRLSFVCIAALVLCVPSISNAQTSTDGKTEAVDTQAVSTQGLWFGASDLLKRKVLLIRDDKLVVITATGAFESDCQFRSKENSLGDVDIDRYDGKTQLGIYKIERDQLFLELADPLKARPEKRDVASLDGKRNQQYTFVRRPTEEGLRVLSKYLSQDSSPQR
ncbi:MAG: hypothetical protein Aurels2KO_03480 [Aureliella sp.]